MKTKDEKLKEINDVLVALTRHTDKSNNEIIEKEKFSMPEFYCAVKKLQFLKRVDSHNNRLVFNNKPVTMEEYRSASDPYGKRERQRVVRKKKGEVLTPAKKGTANKRAVRKAAKKVHLGIYLKKGERIHETLKAPLDIPIYPGKEITISGTAAGIAAFLQLMNK